MHVHDFAYIVLSHECGDGHTKELDIAFMHGSYTTLGHIPYNHMQVHAVLRRSGGLRSFFTETQPSPGTRAGPGRGRWFTLIAFSARGTTVEHTYYLY